MIGLPYIKKISRTTADISAGYVSTLTVEAPGFPIKEGTKLFIKSKDGRSFVFTLSGDISATDTTFRGSTSGDTRMYTYNDIEYPAFIFMYDEDILKKASTKHFYTHQSIYQSSGTNGNDYLQGYGNISFTVNSGATLSDGDSKPNRWTSQYAIFVANEDSTIANIKGWATTNASHAGDDAKIKIWKASPNAGSTTNITIDLVKEFSIANVNNQNHVFNLEHTPTTNNELSKGDVIFCSIQRVGTLHGSVKWYADLGIDIYSLRK